MKTYQKFPIYKIRVYFKSDTCDDSIEINRMFKEKKTAEELQHFANESWSRYVKAHPTDILTYQSFSWKYVGEDSWMLEWFQHSTIDTGQTDEEALSSFEEYVSRKEMLIMNNKDPGCLMGAEDRYRWHGSAPDRHGNTLESTAPCRCDHCVNQGVLRIAH